MGTYPYEHYPNTQRNGTATKSRSSPHSDGSQTAFAFVVLLAKVGPARRVIISNNTADIEYNEYMNPFSMHL